MRFAALLCLTVVSAAIAAPDPYASWRDPIAKIVGKSFDGDAHGQLAELTDTIGPRVTGTPAYAKAAEWAAKQLRAAGLQNVHFEKVTMPHGWQRGTARAAMIAPIARPLHVASHGWSPSTAGTVRGQVVVVDAWDKLPPKLDGKIVLVRRAALAKSQATARAAMATMGKQRVHAMLLEDSSTNNVLSAGSLTSGGNLAPLPAASLGMEDTLAIVRLLEKGPVTIELQLTNTVTGPTEFVNVIGELPGKDKPAEWVLVGAHLDSWDLATGAWDNGAGTVQVIQAARALAAVAPLRRTIRFALWGGEEQFMIGSRAYVLAHAKELDNCITALNSDGAAGHLLGWYADGRPDVQGALAPIGKHLLTSLGGPKIDATFEPGSDGVSFLAEGVPSITLAYDETAFRQVIHRPSDTLDKIDPHGLASGVAVIAVTAFAIASGPDRLAPRKDRKAVEAVFKAHGYDAVMRAEGWWK